MLDPKEIAKFEQGISALSEILPSAAWSLYSEFLKQGFSEAQAMELVCTWIMSVGPK